MITNYRQASTPTQHNLQMNPFQKAWWEMKIYILTENWFLFFITHLGACESTSRNTILTMQDTSKVYHLQSRNPGCNYLCNAITLNVKRIQRNSGLQVCRFLIVMNKNQISRYTTNCWLSLNFVMIPVYLCWFCCEKLSNYQTSSSFGL